MVCQVTTQFNTILDEFMNKMVTTFPEQKKLSTYYKAFKVSRMYDNSLPLQVFMGGCMHYTEEIRERDEGFFKNKSSFVDSVGKCSNFGTDTGLVDYWDSLSLSTRKSIWDYVQTLFVMGENIINKTPKLLSQTRAIYDNMSMGEMKRFENNDVNAFSMDFLTKINS